MNHEFQDLVSLDLARQVAARLQACPDLLAVAHANLDRWSKHNAGTPSLLRGYEEWREILKRPLDEICAILCAETDDGQRLRQNSPFPGILTPAEVWAIKSRRRHHATLPA